MNKYYRFKTKLLLCIGITILYSLPFHCFSAPPKTIPNCQGQLKNARPCVEDNEGALEIDSKAADSKAADSDSKQSNPKASTAKNLPDEKLTTEEYDECLKNKLPKYSVTEEQIETDKTKEEILQILDPYKKALAASSNYDFFGIMLTKEVSNAYGIEIEQLSQIMKLLRGTNTYSLWSGHAYFESLIDRMSNTNVYATEELDESNKNLINFDKNDAFMSVQKTSYPLSTSDVKNKKSHNLMLLWPFPYQFARYYEIINDWIDNMMTPTENNYIIIIKQSDFYESSTYDEDSNEYVAANKKFRENTTKCFMDKNYFSFGGEVSTISIYKVVKKDPLALVPVEEERKEN